MIERHVRTSRQILKIAHVPEHSYSRCAHIHVQLLYYHFLRYAKTFEKLLPRGDAVGTARVRPSGALIVQIANKHCTTVAVGWLRHTWCL